MIASVEWFGEGKADGTCNSKANAIERLVGKSWSFYTASYE
jgi:hypothetical protein